MMTPRKTKFDVGDVVYLLFMETLIHPAACRIENYRSGENYWEKFKSSLPFVAAFVVVKWYIKTDSDGRQSVSYDVKDKKTGVLSEYPLAESEAKTLVEVFDALDEIYTEQLSKKKADAMSL